MEEISGYHSSQIRLSDLMLLFVKNAAIILLAAIICGCFMFIYMTYHAEPVYESSSSIYIVNQQNQSTTTTGDLSSAEQIKTDAQHMIVSRAVLEDVIDFLGLDMSADLLKSAISVTSPTGTRFIDITVRAGNPALAQQIANEIAIVSRQYILDNMTVTNVRITDIGKYPGKVSSPDIKKNMIMAAIYGAVFAILCLMAIFLADDSIRSEDDIQRNFDIPVLGAIPYYKK